MKSNKSRRDEVSEKAPGNRGFWVWKALKILFIAVLSLFVVVIVAVSVLLWVVFTPERITPIVRNQAGLHIPYQTLIGRVELTFFSTFPNLGININEFSVVSPFAGAPSDTLIKSGNLTCIINARAFWKNRDIIIKELKFDGAYINVYTDSHGYSNYGLLMESSNVEDKEPAGFDFGIVDLKSIHASKLWVSYIDQTAGIMLDIADASFNVSGMLKEDQVRGHLLLDKARLSFTYAGEMYLNNATVALHLPIEMDISIQQLMLKETQATINGMVLNLDGVLVYDTLNQQITTDLCFSGSDWQITDFLALIPPAYLSYLGEFEAGGLLTATGVIRGIINDTLMPVIDANLYIANGHLIHEWLPVPLRQMNGEGYLFLDLYGGNMSYITFEPLTAVSPFSGFSMRGRVDDLMGDMYLDLITDADLLVNEFASYIPDNMDLVIQGRAKGRIKSAFTVSQALDVALEKMKISGSVVFSDFHAVYDSIHLAAKRTAIDFSLPNKNMQTGRNHAFAFAHVIADSLVVSMPDQYSAQLHNGSFWVEMSDVRDTSRIPDIFCRYYMDGLLASMDTIHVTIDNPAGKLFLYPRPGAADQLALRMEYAGKTLHASVGKDMASAKNTAFSIDVINDKTRDDIFLQWHTCGSLSLNHGSVVLSDLSYAIDIPRISLDFDPELFTIHEGRFVIDKSDFGISGVLKNVLSYYRGDSLLIGNFKFESDNTDLAQLMNMTSGFGAKDESAGESAGESADDALDDTSDNTADERAEEIAEEFAAETSPYMVPKGVDVHLEAFIQRASYGSDTITDITGDVRVRDGILVFDAVNFTTPAADMQLTAMYRTPRRNHLYLGIDYHMFDIDISRLLQMIPDIDTLMPMLRSFKGMGEFHMAVETYLDSQYNVKKSTLRGASSIRGQDLVLMDGETFSEIAKTLRFSKRAENRVDSLSAEFTIFREEVDVYPFLIVMDRYKAVVAGRHNFDLSFNYHISLVESPLPVRLGIDVTGTLDKMNYRLASPRYAEFFRPASRRAVESRQLQLRNLIREALIRNVE